MDGAFAVKMLAPENVRGIAPYVPGKPIAETARELGLKEADILKMASNENPLGASPKALAAIRGALDEIHYYPDGSGYDLKAAISRKIGVRAENLVLGNGSNDVLELAARAFLTTADSAVYSQHAFMVYPLVIQAIGAKPIEVPAKDYGTDLEALARAVRGDTKMVFLANPNNPTGTFNAWGMSSRSSRGFRRACWWFSTRPTANTCPTHCALPRRSGSSASPTWSCRARSRKPSASPGCAWATASRTRTWRT
jgi:hypothetical protein